MPKYTKATAYLENFLISQKIITSTITTITIPTHIPALKIAPIASQLLTEITRSSKIGRKWRFILFINFLVLDFFLIAFRVMILIFCYSETSCFFSIFPGLFRFATCVRNSFFFLHFFIFL